MGNDVPREMAALAQNEVTFAVLRDSAIDGMLASGKEVSYRSTVTHSADGKTRVQTSGAIDPMLKDFSISGDVTSESTVFNPMASGFRLPNPGAHVIGNYTVKDAKGKALETDKFEFFGSNIDYHYNRGDLATVAVTRTDAAGNIIQKLNPALSEEKIVDGHFVKDANDQNVRVARLSDGAANCGKENIYNPGNHRTECNWLVDDASLGQTYSYNQTFEGQSRRSVVRVGETPRAIVYQTPEFDAQGNLTAVTTRIRFPAEKKR